MFVKKFYITFLWICQGFGFKKQEWGQFQKNNVLWWLYAKAFEIITKIDIRI